MNAREDEETQQNETTPFLSNASPLQRTRQRPAVMPQVRRLQDNLPDILELDGQPEQTAFSLLVYLHLYQSCRASVERAGSHPDIWPSIRDAASKGKLAEQRSLDVWAHYLDTYPSLPEIQSVLWSRFRLEPNSPAFSRIVDCLQANHAPPALITHPVVQTVMMSTWKYGLHDGGDESHHLLRRFDSLTTPRALHLLHLLIQLAFVGVLAHYLLFPPVVFINLGPNEQASRESFLTMMAAASMLVPWTVCSLAYMAVFLAFLLTLPSVPLPGSLAFTSLHIALILHVLSLHLPDTPGLALFLQPRTTLPLTVLVVQSTLRITLPATLFFLPVFLFSSFLVSASLADSPFSVFGTSAVVPAPMDTRLWFFIFFVLVTIALLLSVAVSYSVAYTFSLVSTEPWDRYSQPVGLLARKIFYRAVVRHTCHTFFPPFNLLRLFVIIPSFCLSRLGYPPIPGAKAVETTMWRLSIGLLGAIAAGFWLWGLI
ncbi:hypothetical protein F5I97DRAFT_1895329 [Phlebopus sp. FC_14]|nr:hypothetical protein F5I97DRAFT_1895329 [Phlebopus sp. FC_14]